MQIRQHIPNLLTLTNLAAGVVALCFLGIEITIICMSISLVADLADGAVARALGVDGQLGAILDSLADLVTFCVVPAVVSFHTIFAGEANPIGIAVLVFYVCMGCYRLARYVVNADEGENFSGMPTPSTALVIVGVWVAMFYGNFELSDWLIYGIFIGCGILNVSTMTMPALKGFSGNRPKQLVFILLALIGVGSLIWSPYTALLIVMTGYVVLGIIFGIQQNKN
jgi:CDP-diacylglycerol--serine O-phosphatidyltransferase